MKAIVIRPGVRDSLHLRDISRPSLEDIPDGRGVRVGIVRAGLCGTDADLARGEYGRAPEGSEVLVLGHESLGRVLEVGGAADDTARPGRLVVVTIRRPGESAHDRVGRPDLSSDDVFIETGISRAHGFLTHEVVVEARYLVPVPAHLEAVAILTEPLSCISKSLRQADQAQQARLAIWEPRRALVTGAGTIGLLATLALRLRGLEVVTYGRRRGPYRNSELIDRLGARYASAADADLSEVTRREGRFDLVFEGSGAAALLEPAIHALAPNGVLALFSVTPGRRRESVDVAGLNQAIVLYNRLIVGSAAASWADYATAVETLARAEAGADTSGWLRELITHRIHGLDAAAIARHLAGGGDAIKTTVEIAPGSFD